MPLRQPEEGRPLSGNRTRARLGLAAFTTAAVAGGVLFVIPSGGTVASFVDRTFGSSVFSTSGLTLQGNETSDISTGAASWTDHGSGNSAANFQPSSGAVTPGSAGSYARFGLRLTPDSTNSASVTMAQGVQISPSMHAGLFRMRVVRSASSTCDLSSFGTGSTFIIGSPGNQPSNFGTMLSPPEDNEQFDLMSDGTPVFLCYEFSLPDSPPAGLPNGAEAVVQWVFSAESTSP